MKLLNEIKIYDKELVKIYSGLLNKILKKKYDWFDKIEITYISYDNRLSHNYMGMEGKIYVDKEWGAKQWREFHYSAPFPSEDEELSFGEIIGGKISEELQNDFKIVFAMVFGEGVPKYMSFNWIDTYFVEKDDNRLRETIKRILKKNL